MKKLVLFSHEEIRTLYRDANDKVKQIKILAQLCDCEPVDIEEFLGLSLESEKRKSKSSRAKIYLPAEAILKARESGVPIKTIAEQYGVSISTIQRTVQNQTK